MTRTARRILVIDDDPGVVDLLCESLNQRGFSAQGLTSPKQALERIRIEIFDLVIADVEMPEMRGTELLAAILRERSNQLVMIITAFGSIELAVSMLKAGACDFVAKPFRTEVLIQAVERALRERQLRREIVRLRARLPEEPSGELVARSDAMRNTLALARRVAQSNVSVLLTGETGTGKSALARFIHQQSQRKDRPFIHLNCAAVPTTLLESELFGVCKGAYTDAREDRPGAFASAADGTLFLDEVGEIPLDGQAKLLHALEIGRVRPLGAKEDIAVNARLLAATNRPLETMLKQGLFRPDLYYRLNVVRIEVPPLRARRDDILPLLDAIFARAAEHGQLQVIGVSSAALRRLLAYDWPGNVRELANVIERAVALADHDTLQPEDIVLSGSDGLSKGAGDDANSSSQSLEDVELAHMKRTLEAYGGNKSAAARALGISRRTLQRKFSQSE